MSADLLRRAAAKMRENAEAATRGPWSRASTEGHGVAVHRGEHDTVCLYATRPDAEHIASWHPAVALGFALMLEKVADNGEVRGDWDDWEVGRIAIAVARAYLGEPS